MLAKLEQKYEICNGSIFKQLPRMRCCFFGPVHLHMHNCRDWKIDHLESEYVVFRLPLTIFYLIQFLLISRLLSDKIKYFAT
jgi:hypothetical protein